MPDKKIIYLTICAFGFGLASTLQIANLSTILQFAGFKSHVISYLWLIAPITGLICQPILGIVSDNMHTRFGRRRPLFLMSTLFGVCGIMFLPFTSNVILLTLLIILLDIGANGNAQLSRALILDLTRGRQRTRAFSWSSALSGLGSMFGGMLPWILIHVFHLSNNHEFKEALPLYIKYSFLIGAILYLFFSCITLFMIEERPTKKSRNQQATLKKILSFGTNVVSSVNKLSNRFWDLSYILLFAWIAIFSVWNFLNINIAQTIFFMPTSAENLNQAGPYLADANVWTSSYMGILQLSSTVFAFLIPSINKYFSIQRIFTFGLFLGGISLIIIAFSTNAYLIALLMILYGITWATLTICPYDIFAKIIPKTNNGYYMGIFNIAIVVPQILTGLLLGPIYKYAFSQQAFKIMLMAGVFLVISAFISFRKHVNKTHRPFFQIIKKLGLRFN